MEDLNRRCSPRRRGPPKLAAVAFSAMVLLTTSASALEWPYPGMTVVQTEFGYEELLQRLREAVKANEMAVVTEASASAGAARRGLPIPGNAVVGVYRNDFAVRMLEASVPAGIEAPLRFYVTETDTGATLAYRAPTAVFAPYKNAALDELAAQLDVIWTRIAEDATVSR